MDSYQTELTDIQKQYAKKAKQREELENLLALKYEKLFADLAEKQRKQAEEEAAKLREQENQNYQQALDDQLKLLESKRINLETVIFITEFFIREYGKPSQQYSNNQDLYEKIKNDIKNDLAGNQSAKQQVNKIS